MEDKNTSPPEPPAAPEPPPAPPPPDPDLFDTVQGTENGQKAHALPPVDPQLIDIAREGEDQRYGGPEFSEDKP
jgi:hypothetical protein